MAIAATKKLVRDGDTWLVPSQTGVGCYAVTGSASRCTCPDFELREQPCKHIYAVEYVVRREENPDGTVTETRAVRVTYRQDWTACHGARNFPHPWASKSPHPPDPRGDEWNRVTT